jgi:hypothetical protein
MRKLFGLMILALFLVVGCGKKTEPEPAADGPKVSAELARLVVIRKEVVGSAEQPTYRGVLTIRNDLEGAIVLERVEYSGSVGAHPMDAKVEQLELEVAPGTATELRLDARFSWKDDAPMNFQRGSLTGTLYYRGPKGKLQQLPFTVEGELNIRGE